MDAPSDASAAALATTRDSEIPTSIGPSTSHTHHNVSTYQDLEARTDLCETCRSIDFDVYFERSVQPYSKNLFADLYRWSTLCYLSHITPLSGCSLCDFIFNLREDGMDLKELRCFEVVGFSFTGYFCPPTSHEKQPFPGSQNVFAFGLMDSSQKYLEPRYALRSFTVEDCRKEAGGGRLTRIRKTSGQIEWHNLKEWLRYCENHHQEFCLSGEFVPGLTVIDCNTSQIVKLPSKDAPYCALSYLWGKNEGVDFTHATQGHLGAMPQTIQDSITATKELGYRYLWVDRYCIPQNDAEEKMRLIHGMGMIYKHAALTLIAAAGDSPDYGLPGVTLGLRRARDSIEIGRWVLTPQHVDVKEAVQMSKWNSRGWTYQEALLSCRRLVFTNSQVYFQCQKMHAFESMPLALDRVDTWLPPNPMCLVFPLGGIGSQISDIAPILHQYYLRHLSYDADVLNGISGILQAYEQKYRQMRFLLGLPILGIGYVGREYWTRVLMAAVMWTGIFPARRRRDFPSWTWAGWAPHRSSHHFKLDWPYLDINSLSYPAIGVWDARARFKLHFADGTEMAWENNPSATVDYAKLEKVGPRLEICAFTFKVKCLEYHERGNVFVTMRSEHYPWLFQATITGLQVSKDELMGMDLQAVIMVSKMNLLSGRNSTALMLVKHTKEDSCYERVAVIEDICLARSDLDSEWVMSEERLMRLTRAQEKTITLQ